MKNTLNQIYRGDTLTRQAAANVLREILAGEIPDVQIAAFLSALQVRRETAVELTGFLDAILAHSIPFPVPTENLLDTCGTGGDGLNTFNISTAVALVLAGAGVKVAKHGNRSSSGKTGSADVWEALGLKLPENASSAERQFNECGITFLFAPYFHPVLKKVGALRRELGVRTTFNLLGPLAHPARVKRQLVGVYEIGLVRKFAEVLRQTGSTEAMVVCSADGMDEFSLSARTYVAHLRNGEIIERWVEASDFGLTSAPLEACLGGDAAVNAQMITGVLIDKLPGPRRDIVVMNAAAGLVVAGKVETFAEGTVRAKLAIDSGGVHQIIEKLRGSLR